MLPFQTCLFNFQQDYVPFRCELHRFSSSSAIHRQYNFIKGAERNGLSWLAYIPESLISEFSESDKQKIWQPANRATPDILFSFSYEVSPTEVREEIEECTGYRLQETDHPIQNGEKKTYRIPGSTIRYPIFRPTRNACFDFGLKPCLKCGSFRHQEDDCFEGIVCFKCGDVCTFNHPGYCVYCDVYHLLYTMDCEAVDEGIPIIKSRANYLPNTCFIAIWNVNLKGLKNVTKEHHSSTLSLYPESQPINQFSEA